jgi:hypothetical protein
LEGRLDAESWVVRAGGVVKFDDDRTAPRLLQAVALLHAGSARLEPLTPWSAASFETVALEDDGAYVAIADDRRVVRFRDAGRVREVLFPRPR